MSASLRTLDVRPLLRSGGEPFDEIMQAFDQLEEGQALRLLATFEPAPLYRMMEAQGYVWSSRPLEGDEWEVVFSPAGQPVPAIETEKAPPPEDWPAPARTLDNRGLPPPEPLVRTLEAVEGMPAGEVLEIWTDRDPLHLYPELARRGHSARPEARGAEGYRVLIRHGVPAGAAS